MEDKLIKSNKQIELKEKVSELEKRVATLEGQVQEQPKRRFIPEDSNGKHYEDSRKSGFSRKCSL